MDDAPRFTSSPLISAPENQTSAGSLTAYDSNNGFNLTYGIVGGADATLFDLNASGDLSFVAAPNFEAPGDADGDNVYEVMVQVSNPEGQSTSEIIEVTVTDVEDGPRIRTDTSPTITENRIIADYISVSTSGDYDELSLAIVGGADAARFELVSPTYGVGKYLQFLELPNFEGPSDADGDNVYEVVVRLSDLDGQSDTEIFQVTIADVDEDLPEIISSSFTIFENGTIVGDILVTNPNAAPLDLTYSLGHGIATSPDAAFFSIDSNGSLSFITPPDYEAPTDYQGNNTYQVTVTVQDSSGFSDSEIIRVGVDDLDDEAPIFVTTDYSIIEQSTLVGALDVFDVDSNQFFTEIEIVGGSDANLFSLDSAGTLAFQTAPSFGVPGDEDGDNIYEIQVRVTDENGNSRSEDVRVTVAALDLAAPVITTTDFSIAENFAPIGTVAALDADTADQDLTYSLFGGADADFFLLDSAGNLVFKQPQNFESPADFNGDNIYEVDVMVTDRGGNSDIETVRVTVTDRTNEIELENLTVDQGIVFSGNRSSTQLGRSVSEAGDINGDGFVDFIVGAPDNFWGRTGSPNFGYPGEGSSYLVFGGAALNDISENTFGFPDGIEIEGALSREQAGYSVSSAGDFNGDGIDDFIVGAPGAGRDDPFNPSGNAYVIFGDPQIGLSNIDLEFLTLDDGFKISNAPNQNFLGSSVSTIGDFNGDGFDDIIISADYHAPTTLDDVGDYEAEAYIVFGGAAVSNIDLSAAPADATIRLFTTDIKRYLEFDVSHAGDVNGDGFDDLIIGNKFGDSLNDDRAFSGESYVIFGGSGTAEIDLENIATGQGFTIYGADGGDFFEPATGDHSGQSVESAGDMNGDGYDDLIIGAPRSDSLDNSRDILAGEVYVVFGGNDLSDIDLVNLSADKGFTIFGLDRPNLQDRDIANVQAGFAVAGAGDFNGDGFDDILVSAPFARTSDGIGEVFVIFGKASHSNIDLADFTEEQGLRIIAPELSSGFIGTDVSFAGDVNGDGFDDVLIGASSGRGYLDDGSRFDGITFLVYGGLHGNDDAPVTTNGIAAAEMLIGGAGDDTLSGGGGADVIRGGAGDDRIVIGDGDFFRIDGGGGQDLLLLDGDFDIDLSALADDASNIKLQSIEALDITGSGDNSLALTLDDLLDISEVPNLNHAANSHNSLIVSGDAGDSVTLYASGADEVGDGGSWVANGTMRIGGDLLSIYDFDLGGDVLASLAIEQDVAVFANA